VREEHLLLGTSVVGGTDAKGANDLPWSSEAPQIGSDAARCLAVHPGVVIAAESGATHGHHRLLKLNQLARSTAGRREVRCRHRVVSPSCCEVDRLSSGDQGDPGDARTFV